MSTEGIELEHFSALPKADINSTTTSCQRYAVFNYYLSNYSKYDAATTTENSKPLISLLKDLLLLKTSLSKIWEKTYGCDEQYIWASALYFMSVMSHCYYIIIGRGISEPGNGKEVLDELNAIDKIYIYKLMSTVQLPG